MCWVPSLLLGKGAAEVGVRVQITTGVKARIARKARTAAGAAAARRNVLAAKNVAARAPAVMNVMGAIEVARVHSEYSSSHCADTVCITCATSQT